MLSPGEKILNLQKFIFVIIPKGVYNKYVPIHFD